MIWLVFVEGRWLHCDSEAHAYRMLARYRAAGFAARIDVLKAGS